MDMEQKEGNKKNRVKKIYAIVAVLLALSASPVVAQGSDIVLAVEKMNESMREALVIINDIEGRTQTLLAAHPGDEKIIAFHEKLNEVQGMAKHIHDHLVLMEKPLKDPMRNKETLKEMAAATEKHTQDLVTLTNEAHNLVHPVMFKYEKENATKIHDLIHNNLTRVVEQINDQMGSFGDLLDSMGGEPSDTQKTDEGNISKTLPLFSISWTGIFLILGCVLIIALAVAYLIRRRGDHTNEWDL